MFTSQKLNFLNLRRGRPGPLPPPVESMDGRWSAAEEAMVNHAFRESIAGSPDTVRAGLAAFLARTQVDELMITAAIFDQGARVRSFEIVAGLRHELEAGVAR